MHALDILRLEKKFLHWGHDITSETNPIEAGLSFAINLKNKNYFIGRNSIEKIIQKPLKKQLDLFSLNKVSKPGKPLLLHDEPIYSKKNIVGSTTSSNYSFCYKKNICFAYIRNDIDKENLYPGDYVIDIAKKILEDDPKIDLSDFKKIFPLLSDISLNYSMILIKNDLKSLGISHDNFVSEKSLVKKDLVAKSTLFSFDFLETKDSNA